MPKKMEPKNMDPLVVGKVIGDVVDMFQPQVIMSIYYGSKHITNGCHIIPSLASERPHFTLTGNSNRLYTLVMTNPDAPNPSEPSLREWVHWIVTDIPGSNPTRGKEVVEYMGPTPKLGIQRFVFVLFEQKEQIAGADPLIFSSSSSSAAAAALAKRSNFSTRDFAKHFDLGLPVSAVYFHAQREPASNKRR